MALTHTSLAVFFMAHTYPHLISMSATTMWICPTRAWPARGRVVAVDPLRPACSGPRRLLTALGRHIMPIAVGALFPGVPTVPCEAVRPGSLVELQAVGFDM